MNLALALFFFAVAICFDGDTLTGGVAALVVTFFGLLAAAILPALSLLAANTISPGLSVAKTDALRSKLERLIGSLLKVLAMLLVGSVAVILHQIGLPDIVDLRTLPSVSAWIPTLPKPIQWLADEFSKLVYQFPSRFTQAVAFVCFSLCLNRMRIVASAFRSVLIASYELAVTDSRKRLSSAVPSGKEIDEMFPKRKDFGERISRSSSSDGEGRG